MSITLEKNSTISLTKSAPALSNIMVGLGWDVAAAPKGFFKSLFSGSDTIDLDASCILIDANNNIIDTVWFRKLNSDCRAVHHQGDNLTGAGDGDDEKIDVDLKRLNPAVKHIAITVNSFRGQTFEKVDNAYCRIVDQSGGEMCRFTLKEQGNHTGLYIGLLSHNNNEWTFSSKGLPVQGQTAKDMSGVILKSL